MKDLLTELNGFPGVQGSMVVSQDGIMVAAALKNGLEEDVVAALSSSLVLTIQRALEPTNADPTPEEMVLSASNGKLVFINLGRAYLVVVTQPHLKLSSDFVELRSVARKLRSRCEMTS
ncbi:MAG: roadblock/LC7 domain-containing protein [Planctomycetota bacterium]